METLVIIAVIVLIVGGWLAMHRELRRRAAAESRDATGDSDG